MLPTRPSITLASNSRATAISPSGCAQASSNFSGVDVSADDNRGASLTSNPNKKHPSKLSHKKPPKLNRSMATYSGGDYTNSSSVSFRRDDSSSFNELPTFLDLFRRLNTESHKFSAHASKQSTGALALNEPTSYLKSSSCNHNNNDSYVYADAYMYPGSYKHTSSKTFAQHNIKTHTSLAKANIKSSGSIGTSTVVVGGRHHSEGCNVEYSLKLTSSNNSSSGFVMHNKKGAHLQVIGTAENVDCANFQANLNNDHLRFTKINKPNGKSTLSIHIPKGTPPAI